MLKLHVLLVSLFILHLQGDYITQAADNNGVVNEPIEEPADSQVDEGRNDDSHNDEADVNEDSPLIDEDYEDDDEDDEARELDHSRLSNDETNSDGDSGKDEVVEEENKKDDEGTIEVIFDSGGVKVTKKINIMPGLQLMLSEAELEEEEEDEELENVDTEIEEEDTVTAEEGDELFEEAMKMLSRRIGSHGIDRPYQLLSEAVAMGNSKAKEQIGYFNLFGMHVAQNFTKAREIFAELAAEGNPAGQMGLGFLFSAGLGVNASQTKAIVYYTFAALQGHPLAQMAMGYRSHMGISVPLNCEDALTYYSQVAKKVADGITITGGTAISRVRLLDEEEQISDGNMDEDLIQYYQFLAEKGDLQAQMLLGQLYMQGLRGVPRDFKKALYYFSLADEEKNAAAQGFMGKIYAEGSEDVPANSATALEYFKGAAKKGNPIGYSGLGMMYMNGMGTKQDYTKAFKYSAQSAEMGWLDGQLQLGIMYYHGYGMQRNYHQALRYFSLASQSGSTLAIYYLAVMHAYGIGVSKSCHTAVEFMKTVAEKGRPNQLFVSAYDLYKMGEVDTSIVQYFLLAELGYEVAQSNSAYIAENGLSELVNNDDLLHKRLLMLWSRAAGQGNGIARLKMGDYYYYGKGTVVNYHTAASHYRIASEQQSIARAMFNLGYMYEEGIGLEQDFHLAKRYYDLAVETDQSAQVPVSMALMKLHFTYYYELFSKQLRDFELSSVTVYLRVRLGRNWDMYLLTFLVLLATLIYLTRQYRIQLHRNAAQRQGQ